MVGTLNIVNVHLWNGKRTDNFQLDYSSPKLKCNSDKIFMMNYQVENHQTFFYSTSGQISTYES